MKSPLTFLLTALLLLSASLLAEEAIPQEKVREMARKAVADLPKLESAPFAFEGDTDQPQLAIHEGIGVMILPAKGLAADKIAGVAGTPLPVGQLWLRLIDVTKGGQPLPQDKIRTHLVQTTDEQLKVSIYLLGVVKNAQGQRELVLYGKDAQPLLNVPLVEATSSQSLPIELGGEQTSESSGTLTLKILGQFTASLQVGKSGS